MKTVLIAAAVAVLGLAACHKHDADTQKADAALAGAKDDATALAKDAGTAAQAGADEAKKDVTVLAKDAGQTAKEGASDLKQGAQKAGAAVKTDADKLKDKSGN